MIRRAVPLVAVLACAVLVGCARPGEPNTGPSGPAPSDDGSWVTYAAEVTGVRPGTRAESLSIDVYLPDGRPGCARAPRVGYHTEENDTLYANVVFDSARAQPVGGCPGTTTATVTLTSATPIGSRPIVLNQQPWALSGATYVKCAPDLGCTPPADHCAGNWTLAAFNGLDVPRHAGRSVEHCDQNWLIMKVDVNTAQCGAGGRPGCSAPPSVARHFLRFRDGWREFAQTRTGGCAVVRAADPTFPPSLCEDLPPTG